MAVMAQFSANIGSPLGIMDGGIMGMGAPMQMENPVTWSAEAQEAVESKAKNKNANVNSQPQDSYKKR